MAKSDEERGSGRAPRRRERPLRGDLARIGRKLGQRYDTVADEPMPDRLAALLERIEARERGSDGRG